jgi:hypothetical protein
MDIRRSGNQDAKYQQIRVSGKTNSSAASGTGLML